MKRNKFKEDEPNVKTDISAPSPQSCSLADQKPSNKKLSLENYLLYYSALKYILFNKF